MLGVDRDEGAVTGVLTALTLAEELDPRLDAVLDAAADASELPARFIYLTAADGRRLHMARARSGPVAIDQHSPSWAQPGSVTSSTTGEGASEATAAMPPIEMAIDQAREQRSMPTAAGLMHALPLELGDELVGLVLLGPLKDGGQLGGRQRRRLSALMPALAALARQAHREQTLRDEIAALTSREEVARRLAGSTLEVDRLVTVLLDLAVRSTRSDGGFVAVIDAQHADLSIRARTGLPDDFLDPDFSAGHGAFDWDLAGELGTLGLRDIEWASSNGIDSILAVPLIENERPLGVFALVSFTNTETFSEANLALLETYSEQIRLMLDNSRLFAEFRRRYLDSLRGLATSLDARRPHTVRHHMHVGEVATSLAERLGAESPEIESVGLAAAIHDIGLLAITETEAFAADQEHPLIGAGMVEHLPLDPAIGEAIATHHEWYDGWGFPRGLRGAEIGRHGRILAVAEFVVERIEAPAPLGVGDAARLVSELQLRRGSQLDPEATDAAVEMIASSTLPAGLSQHLREDEGT